MIPLRDDVPSQRMPIVTLTLIGVNVAIFVKGLLMPESELGLFLFRYGLIPAKLFGPENVASFYSQRLGMAVPGDYTLAESLVPMFTCTFLHGGWIHIIGNMWMLWIFGDSVEDVLGHVGFLLFYLAAGLISSTAHMVASSLSPVVTIGASGAVAGVMGAYLVLFPRARVLTLVPIVFFFYLTPLPAILFLFFWFGIQVLSVTAELGGQADVLGGGIAWWAHIGGFLAGFGFILISGIRAPKEARISYRPRGYYPKRKYRYK